MSSALSKNVTIAVKTFESPHCILRLLRSIRRFYPDVPIVVTDDSQKSLPSAELARLGGIEYYRMPFDSGVGAGRSLAASKVKTPYMVMLDDDFVFVEETRLEGMLALLARTPEIDLVAGSYSEVRGVRRYEACLDVAPDKTLVWSRAPSGYIAGCAVYDVVLTFYMGRTAKICAVDWDHEQKNCEHVDFFYRAKGKLCSVYAPEFTVAHVHDRKGVYSSFRGRGRDYYYPLFLRKHGLYRERPANFTYYERRDAGCEVVMRALQTDAHVGECLPSPAETPRPHISICVTSKNRTKVLLDDEKSTVLELFPKFADSLAQAFGPKDPVELVVADWGSTDWPLKEWLPSRLGSVPVRIVQVGKAGFSRGHGLNVAAEHARGDVLFFTDCDMLLTRDVVVSCAADVQLGYACFPVIYRNGFRHGTPTDWATQGYGNAVVHRELFEHVGGWPEYYTWGAEDNVFFDAVSTVAVTRRPYMREFEHQWHPSSVTWKDRYNHQTHLVLVTGTGCCGLREVATLIDQQPDWRATHNSCRLDDHETRPMYTRWQAQVQVCQALLRRMLLGSQDTLVADASHSWLPYIEFILEVLDPTVRVIGVWDAPEKVVAGWLQRTKGCNPWMKHNGTRWTKDATLDVVFPHYKVQTKEDAIRKFWEDYRDTLAYLARKYPQRVRVWHRRDLATQKSDILEFLRLK